MPASSTPFRLRRNGPNKDFLVSKINFCPRCASPLTDVFDGGRDRHACPANDCGFVHFGDFSIGCSGVVLREEAGTHKALLIQRGQEPFAGTWQLPGGYVENDELLSLAVEREIEEEAGVAAKVIDVVAFRHMLGGPSSNIYMIFRLEYVAGEPRYDGGETADAGVYSLDDMATMRGVQNISRWGIEQALQTNPGSGLTLDTTGTRLPRWQVFGLTETDPAVWRQR